MFGGNDEARAKHSAAVMDAANWPVSFVTASALIRHLLITGQKSFIRKFYNGGLTARPHPRLINWPHLYILGMCLVRWT